MVTSAGTTFPSLTTLQKWLSDFRLEPGSSELQMQLLKKMMSGKPDRYRQCVLMFDEMDILSQVTYDNGRDQMFGPYRHLQVLMVAGIFDAWKLPVLFMFDQPVTRDLLESTIAAAEAAGTLVAAIVCDQGGSNRAGLWRQLNICHDGDVFFPNPSDGRCVEAAEYRMMRNCECSRQSLFLSVSSVKCRKNLAKNDEHMMFLQRMTCVH